MDSETKKTLDTTKKYLTTAASIAASAMFARTIINEYLPNELRSMVSSGFDNIFSRFSTEHTIVIQETEGLSSNELYDASTTYLRTRISPSMKRLRASKHEDKNNIALSLDDGEELIDVYRSVEFRWLLISHQENQSGSRNQQLSFSTEVRWLELSFHKKHKKIALDSYLPHILERSKEIKAADRKLKLFMNQYESWSPIDLHHPATFETLAMESELKRTIMEDLARFVKRKEYYQKIGKAWKRGYLLYGPPGTGKSSLIAAMANYLRFDIYDMDLKEVNMNSGLKRLLIGMANKSLLVIEDIDCSIDLQNRDDGEKKSDSNNEVTLSGLLNFIDGLWSTSGEERIIVFTTNYKDRLDPALLRPGRMDMHIHMGYCGPSSFRILASNYHAVDDHPMFAEIEGLLEEMKATPAEVAEELMRSDDVDIAFGGLLQLLHRKKGSG
ncbi:ATP-dependent zinc metalloprotease FTSH 8, chloroplastic [Apostasia shenzhenica]|uniref:ATP-dependent zinc metalloprotease FTSH 8, chloroplastic n=1 Tax=Apostasia shenzhenica TaxID=1088818 RepID=A0A2I0A2J8_9ASPA|nr:ATP-dependent zinc metalloprotease FTSH 8, chloroplastic [Apostasia shenzhenica]